MPNTEDKNTRYFVDLDLLTREIVHWGYDQRERLADKQVLDDPYHRVFLSRGQYHKLIRRNQELRGRING